MQSHTVLLIAFAFAVMGDPVSSVAYAIEAALRALGGDLKLLVPTMLLVVVIIGLVITNYHRLVERFPGGGDAAATGSEFGEGWAFMPLGALIVDFTLTIAISVAAAASAIIALFPATSSARLAIAMVLLVAVAALTWFGHGGRAVFAAMTIAFLVISTIVLAWGFIDPHGQVEHSPPQTGHSWAPLAVLLAFPVAMALATGVEAPSSAIAQLGQLNRSQRVHFGRVTLWLTLGIVGGLTLALTVLAVRLHVGVPPADSTQVADIARASVGHGPLFAAFQVASAVLLLAAASSSFQAGPGLLKALTGDDTSPGILPEWLGHTNTHHTPYWGVVVFLIAAAAVVGAAGGHDQELVLFYAVTVFISFLFGLLAMSRVSRRARNRGFLVVNLVSIFAVGLTLTINLARIYPLVSVAAACLIALALHRLWTRAGRPAGISEAESHVA